MNKAVKACGADIGMSAAWLSTHSLRRGGSCAMAAAKLGDKFRKLFCAWKSDTHKIYKDPMPRACASVATRMLNAKFESAGTRT